METVRVRVVDTPKRRVAAVAAKSRAEARREARKLRLAGIWTVTAQIGGTAILGWFLMIVVGVVHLNWIAQLPPVDYPTAVWVAALIRVVAYTAR